MITVTKETGLGLKILGGINRNEGPFVYIQEIIPGGDCYKVKMKKKKKNLHKKTPHKPLVTRFVFYLISIVLVLAERPLWTKELENRPVTLKELYPKNEYEIKCENNRLQAITKGYRFLIYAIQLLSYFWLREIIFEDVLLSLDCSEFGPSWIT